MSEPIRHFRKFNHLLIRFRGSQTGNTKQPEPFGPTSASGPKRSVLYSLLLLGSLFAGNQVFAATSIGVNFQGRNETTQVATTPLAATDVAGVVPQGHWNNIDDNAVSNKGTSAPLVDATGAATPVTVTFDANDSWSNDTAPNAITTPNARMMNGIMKASTGTAQTLTFTNLSAASYDAYVYLNENGDGAQITVDGGSGTVYFVTETHQFYDSSHFIQATNTDTTGTPDLGNYVKLSALTPADGVIKIVVTHITGTDGAGLAGVQLITPSGATPISIVTQPLSQTTTVGNSVTLGTFAYGDAPKFQWFKNGTAIPNATNSFYATPTLAASDSGAKYHVVVSNAGNSVTSSDATITVKAATVVPGFLRHEYYPNVVRADVEHGVSGAPSFVEALPSFETKANDGINNFTETVSGFFTPAVTGNYVFFISADDDSDLYLSTDATPEKSRLIAQETAWSNPREWTVSSGNSSLTQKRSDQFSPDGGTTVPFADGIPLTQGTAYYIRGVHHQGGGGDNLSVTFKLAADADPVNPDTTAGTPGEATKLTGSVISFNSTPTTSLTISQQPTNSTVTEGFIATFTVTAQTDSELTPKYQWKRNGTPIAGATGPVYSPTVTAADNGAKYSVTVSVPGFATSVTSAEATLTVRSPVFTPGFLKYELWLNKVRTDVESGNAGAPTLVNAMPSMQTTNNAGEPSNYADRLSGFFIPATNGNYVFFLGSDDDGDLYLSTDATAANKKLIAREAGYSGFDNWTTIGATSTSADKRSDQFANSSWPTPNVITLTAGTRYYIEADHHEGGGGDWLGAYVKLDTEDDPTDGTPSNLTGSRIGFFVAPATVTIAKQPANVSGTEGFGATFTATGSSDSQVNVISYQWQKNGVDIAGATGASYTTPPLAQSDSTNKYRVVINAPGATAVTSTEVSATVGTAVFSTGILKHQVWNGISDRAQAEADTLGVPTVVETLANFQTPFNAGDPPSTYTDRISGFFIPDVTGAYVFFVGSDDQSDLYLSTDENPANRKLIAQESIWSNSGQWLTSGGGSILPDKRSDTFAASEWPTPNVITLTKGTHYYIEVDHQEGTGGDWVGVYAKLNTAADPADGTPSNLTGNRIAAFGPPQATSTAPRFTSITAANGNVTVSWTGTGTLQQATQLTGSASDWSDVTPAPTGTSYTVNGTSGNRFFRLKQ